MKRTKNLGLLSSGGLLDLFDNQLKSAFNLSDEEYDYIAINATDDELVLFVKEVLTFKEKREVLAIRSKYLNEINATK